MIVPQKRFSSREDYERFIREEKAWMHGRTTDSITEAFRRGYESAMILEVIIEDETLSTITTIVMEMSISDWINSLGLSLKWYVSQEDYEKCTEIRDMIEDIRVLLDIQKRLP